MGKKRTGKKENKHEGQFVPLKKECCEKYKKKGRCCKSCPQRDSCPVYDGDDQL